MQRHFQTDTIYLKEIKETEDTITAFENSEIDLRTMTPQVFLTLATVPPTKSAISQQQTCIIWALTAAADFSNPLCRKVNDRRR